MFVLTASYGEYSERTVHVIAVSADKEKLERRIEVRNQIDALRRDWFEQLQKNIKHVELDYPPLTGKFPGYPKCDPIPKTNKEHEAREAVKRQYEAEIRTWQMKEFERQETIRELAVQKLRVDNPSISEEEIAELNWRRCEREEPAYEIEEVEEIL
jgi:hypothetical protein